MDPNTLLILGGLALVAIVAMLYILNRSWGNFPKDARYQPSADPPAPARAGRASPAGPWTAADDQPDAEQLASAQIDRPEPASWLVPIKQPMVRKAAEAALERGGAPARYVVRQGDQLFFDFSQISDPAERRQAYELMRRFEAGENVDLRAMMQVVKQLVNS